MRQSAPLGLLDCRPIPLPELPADGGWHLRVCQPLCLAGLPARQSRRHPARN